MSGLLVRGGLVAVVVGLFATFAVAQEFENVAGEWGLNYNGSCGTPFWFDFDFDGDLDVLVTHRFSSPTHLYENLGDRFVIRDCGLPVSTDIGNEAPMDFDHDGDYDLLLQSYHTVSKLMVNEDGVYVDRTAQLGFPSITGLKDADWEDFDRDGWMDIVWDQQSTGWHMHRNVNGQQFVDVTPSTNLPDYSDVATFCMTDIDLDSDFDLFLTRYEGAEKFYLNLGDGVFEDRTVSAGLTGIDARTGCDFADFNNDKYPDFLTQDEGTHGIWLNNHDGTFTQAVVHGMETDFYGGGAPCAAFYAIADYDMDGDLDVFASRPGGGGIYLADDQLFRFDRIDGVEIWFTNVAAQYGMDESADGYGRWGDMDNDGDQDLIVVSQDRPLKLWKNNTVNSANRLTVELVGPNGERDCWHTRLELYAHGTTELVSSSQLGETNVRRNGFDGYFVLDPNAAYDVVLHTSSGVVMGPETHPNLSGVVPSQIGHHLSVVVDGETGVSIAPSVVPQEFGITSAYPNPFNALTKIQYTVANEAPVRVSIYDLTGREVALLVSETQHSGTHETSWNAERFGSGLYFVELAQGGRFDVQKVVLLK